MIDSRDWIEWMVEGDWKIITKKVFKVISDSYRLSTRKISGIYGNL